MNQEPENHWKRLAAAARGAPPAEPAPHPTREEVARQLAGLRALARRLFMTWLWRKWSLWAMLLAVLLYLAVRLFLGSPTPDAPGGITIPLPAPP